MPKTVIVVGAGIVGLHVAHVLNEQGYDVFVLERDATLGEQTSGRNSGVIHAGIFYPSDSLKEQSSIEGNRLTYEWLERLKLKHRACGKWLVPEAGQEAELEPSFEKILGLPIPTPRLLSPTQVKDLQPQLRALPAIEVPSTGLVDAAAYVKALAVYTENNGVQVLTACQVEEIHEQKVKTSRGEMEFELAVNCAGLFADRVAAMAGVEGYEVRPCRGDYYIMNKNLICRPIYHLPYKDAPGLGVHLTPTLDGQTLIGPNAFFIDEKLDYKHNSDAEVFEQAVDYYLPDLQSRPLQPAYAGNRPKLFYNDEAVHDFVVKQEGAWIHLLGIESPGLTAAPALARMVLDRIGS